MKKLTLFFLLLISASVYSQRSNAENFLPKEEIKRHDESVRHQKRKSKFNVLSNVSNLISNNSDVQDVARSGVESLEKGTQSESPQTETSTERFVREYHEERDRKIERELELRRKKLEEVRKRNYERNRN